MPGTSHTNGRTWHKLEKRRGSLGMTWHFKVQGVAITLLVLSALVLAAGADWVECYAGWLW
jgi:hypothetical protein